MPIKLLSRRSPAVILCRLLLLAVAAVYKNQNKGKPKLKMKT